MKQVPFNIELAKKIQSGEIEGRIVQNNGLPATILAFDINGENLAVRFMRKDGTEGVDEHQPNGKVMAEWCSGSEEFALVIELLEEAPKHEFKVGDKVRVKVPDEVLQESMIYGTYQNKTLTVKRIINEFTIEVGSSTILPHCFPPEYLEPYEKKREFKPFDRVLVRDSEEDEWQCNLFSHLNVTGSFRTMGGDWMYCIPYEGNEHLVGTTDKPKED